MGMAASQARYLELTARKTNVEYEGQQVNQQRMSLANESAGLFTQLMSLAVPTAPSSSTYTTTNYTFSNGENTCTLAGVRYIEDPDYPDYNAEVTYYYNESTYTGIGRTRTDRGVRLAPGGIYWLTDGAPGGDAVNRIMLTQCSQTNNAKDIAALEQIVADTGENTPLAIAYDHGAGIGNIYYYTAGGVTHYYCNADLNAVIGAHPLGDRADLTGYYAAYIDRRIENTEYANLTTADSGRYSTIVLQSTGETPLDITAKPVTDQNAYNDAMNEYEYQQQLYQQQVNNINAKTSLIQVQDRTLELKLRQLDTEQRALSTEMDSVKKIIEKNVEQTFKTFQ